MENIKNEYQINKVKASLEGLYVILTNSNKMIANVATISKVEVMNNNNDLILELTGNMRNTEDEIFFKVYDVFYKLTLKTVLTNVSKEILRSYMSICQGRINYSYELFEFGKFGSKVKRVRTSNSGGIFLEWYNDDRNTIKRISSYDGIWVCGNYLRVHPIIPPSVEFNLCEYLFEKFNESKVFTSKGSYKINNKCFITVNEIVISELKTLVYLDNFKIVGTDNFGKEIIIFSDKEKSQDSSNIA